MDEANLKRAALAAGAGAAGAVLLYTFLHLFGSIELEGGNLLSTSAEENRRLWIRLLTTQLLPYLVVLGISGALPARSLSIGWRRAFAFSLMAYVSATMITIVVSLVLDLLVTVRETQFGTILLVLTNILILMFAIRKAPPMLLVAATFIVAVAFLLAPVLGGYVGLISWIILPPIAALLQSPPNNDERGG